MSWSASTRLRSSSPKTSGPCSGAAGYVDWRLCGGLSRVLQERLLHGRPPAEQLLLPTAAAAARREAVRGRASGGLGGARRQALGACSEGGAQMLTRAGVRRSVALAFAQLAADSIDAARDAGARARFAAGFRRPWCRPVRPTGGS